MFGEETHVVLGNESSQIWFVHKQAAGMLSNVPTQQFFTGTKNSMRCCQTKLHVMLRILIL